MIEKRPYTTVVTNPDPRTMTPAECRIYFRDLTAKASRALLDGKTRESIGYSNAAKKFRVACKLAGKVV